MAALPAAADPNGGDETEERGGLDDFRGGRGAKGPPGKGSAVSGDARESEERRRRFREPLGSGPDEDSGPGGSLLACGRRMVRRG